jgi:hypothetical protein
MCLLGRQRNCCRGGRKTGLDCISSTAMSFPSLNRCGPEDLRRAHPRCCGFPSCIIVMSSRLLIARYGSSKGPVVCTNQITTICEHEIFGYEVNTALDAVAGKQCVRALVDTPARNPGNMTSTILPLLQFPHWGVAHTAPYYLGPLQAPVAGRTTPPAQ